MKSDLYQVFTLSTASSTMVCLNTIENKLKLRRGSESESEKCAELCLSNGGSVANHLT